MLDFKDITLLSKKSFLEYFTVILLDQQVDAFDLIAIADKIDAIKSLDFSYTLTDLELYLKLTKYLRDYVFFYAQKTEILQRRKIIFLKISLSNKRRTRKLYSQRTIIDLLIEAEVDFYRQIQEFFLYAIFLIYFDLKRVLYINIDAFKRRDFRAIIYYLKVGADLEKSRRNNIESILFLSRLLNFAETRY